MKQYFVFVILLACILLPYNIQAANDGQLISPAHLLCQAIRGNDLAAVRSADRQLIANARYAGGYTAFHVAARYSTEEVALALLQGNVSCALTQTDDRGRTPFAVAAARGNVSVMGLLHRLGADVEQTDKAGRTPLDWAIQRRQDETVKYLVNFGLLPQQEASKRTLVFETAAKAEAEKLEKLFAHGITINPEDLQILLMQAAHKNRGTIAQVLLQNGAKMEQKSIFPPEGGQKLQEATPVQVAQAYQSHAVLEVFRKERAKQPPSERLENVKRFIRAYKKLKDLTQRTD